MKDRKIKLYKKNKKEIPIFFATDDNYIPFLDVALRSLIDNASKNYNYIINILNTGLKEDNMKAIKLLENDNFKIVFRNISDKIDGIRNKLRNVYHFSVVMYYRIFIESLFPEYDKVLYLDCDIVVLGDIAELYNNDISNLYLAASPEEVMAEVKVFGDYVEKALDVPVAEYFNAGIMVMNLAELRKDNIEKKFFEMINRFRFRVTQDEDYLNVLCKGKTKILDLGWNKTAFKNEKFDDKNLKLIHYKINWKPWKNRNVLYEDYFWNYAKKTEFYDLIRQKLENYTDAQREKDEVAYQNLVQMAIDDMADPYNYKNMMDKEKGEQ
jgi:lipopolysaccharide biosynthesis glycosyltransferase